jgi:glycerol-3-phosphate O-acyltransferase
MTVAGPDIPAARATWTAGHLAIVATPSLSPVEERIVQRWLRQIQPKNGGRIQRIPLTEAALETCLDGPEETLIAPVGIAWLLPSRDGERRIRASDLLALGNPHRPPTYAQAWIARRSPDRCRIVVAEGATIAELRRRWLADTAADRGGAAFAAYVRRQGAIALERANRRVVGDRYKVPRLIAEEITASARFERETADLAARLGTPVGEVREGARTALESLVAVQSRLAADVFTAVFSPLHARAWRVDADSGGLERLRALNRERALVFLPTHRSYVDSLVLARVLADHDFPRNHVLGGNNVAFWPLGPLGRRAGTIWIRRSFSDDEPYKLAIREYLGYLLSKRFNLEWYIEGGRSRSGKLRPPRYGLLRFLVQALETGAADDVLLVPVAITYDGLPELEEMVAEEGGRSKKPEGIDWLIRYFRGQWRRAGTAAVQFGEPLSLRDGMAEQSVDTPEGRLALQKTVFEVCVRINDATPILTMSLVTLALLGGQGRGLTLDEVRAVLDPMLDYVERRGYPARDLEALHYTHGIERDLQRLERAGVVTRFDGGTQTVYLVEPGRHHVAAFYRNSAIHWFLNRAIVEITMLAALRIGESAPVQDAWREALALRDLLKYEFFFEDKSAFRTALGDEMALIDEHWETRARNSEDVKGILLDSRPLMAHRVLRPFIDGYFVVAERLAGLDPSSAVDEAPFLQACKAQANQYLLQRRLLSPEAASTEIFTNALKVAANRDLLEGGDADVAEGRRLFLEELEHLRELLGHIETLDAA